MYSIKLRKCSIGRKNCKQKLGQKSLFYFASFYHKHNDGDIERVSIDTTDLILVFTLSNSVGFRKMQRTFINEKFSSYYGKELLKQ